MIRRRNSLSPAARTLRAALAMAGTTAYRLAARLGISPTKLSSFAHGRLEADATRDLAAAIEKTLGLTPGALGVTDTKASRS